MMNVSRNCPRAIIGRIAEVEPTDDGSSGPTGSAGSMLEPIEPTEPPEPEAEPHRLGYVGAYPAGSGNVVATLAYGTGDSSCNSGDGPAPSASPSARRTTS